jgi:hypothetical protein
VTTVTSTLTHLDIILQAIEQTGRAYEQRGIYYITNCPGPNHARGDQNPSLHIWEVDADNGRTTIRTKCQSGNCTPAEIYKGFGITSKSIPMAYAVNNLKEPVITLFDLAEHTGIDWQILFNLGWQDSVETFHKRDGTPYKLRGVIHRYFLEDGTEYERHKLRVRLEKIDDKNRWVWTEGDVPTPIAYGLQTLDKAREHGSLVVVEGESDYATLYGCYGIPCLGIPGAGQVTKTLHADKLNDIPRVYVIQEKTDQAGINFPYAVQVRLKETGYTGEILRVPLRTLTGAKDPNELHKSLIPAIKEARSTTPFTEAFQRALDQAKPMDTDTGEEGQKYEIDTSSLDKAISERDQEGLVDTIPLLAQLDDAETLRQEIKIKAAFKGQGFDFKSFTSAVAKAKKAFKSEQAAAQARNAGAGNVEYSRTDDGMAYYSKFGEVVPLSNFTAEIVADVITDDGAERTRSYEIEAQLFQHKKRFDVPAKDFTKSDWIDEHLGARARVTTGQSIKSHLINAIKYCSDPQEQYKYAHTGWRNIDGSMFYLHAGGFISQTSQEPQGNSQALTNLLPSDETACKASLENNEFGASQASQISQEKNIGSVNLNGSLSHYILPPPDREAIQQSVHASLCFLDLTSDVITVPLYCALWRSVLPVVDFAIHLAGQSGLGKTELAVLIQQHFGIRFDSRNLPGTWESTENSLEMLLFQAKDTVVVVDDFKPVGGRNAQDNLHKKADRVFRAIGNGAGRGRLNSNLEQRAERRPRCMLISTGEDVPRGQSLKARCVVLTMTEKITETGSAASKKLEAAQKEARSGMYAQVMAAYLEWLAPRIETIQAQLPDLIANERNRLNIAGHGRSGTNTANLLLGMRYFLQFACECNALTTQEAQSYLERCERALRQIAEEAAQENAQERPSEQWLRLVRAAITSKGAYLASPKGDCPGTAYGWNKSIRSIEHDGHMVEEETFRGGGQQIGWIDGDDIYLLPEPAYTAAKKAGSASGDEITTLESMLYKYLEQDNMLASTDLKKARKTITIRKYLESAQQRVLHLKKEKFFPAPDDTPDKLPDSSDSSDSSASAQAPQATSEPSQVNGNSVIKSSQVLDYPDLSTSSPAQSAPTRAENPIRTLYAELEQYLEKCKPGLLSVRWFAPGTSFENRNERITAGAYKDRVIEELSSKDQKRIAAMVNAIEKLLAEAGAQV